MLIKIFAVLLLSIFMTSRCIAIVEDIVVIHNVIFLIGKMHWIVKISLHILSCILKIKLFCSVQFAYNCVPFWFLCGQT